MSFIRSAAEATATRIKTGDPEGSGEEERCCLTVVPNTRSRESAPHAGFLDTSGRRTCRQVVAGLSLERLHSLLTACRAALRSDAAPDMS